MGSDTKVEFGVRHIDGSTWPQMCVSGVKAWKIISD